jgi:tRNA(adenine34) deaminase
MSKDKFMREALVQARRAFDEDEVPVGAVAVIDEEVIASAHNVREKTSNPLGHAEMLLLEGLAKEQKSWRLEDVTVYVTCEPCLMCAGALIQARIPRVVYGCRDPKAGACDSLYEITRDERLNHRIETIGGVMEEECAQILTEFFRMKRKK